MLKDFEKQSIQVTIRVRPLSDKQLHEDNRICIKPDNTPQRLTLLNGNQSKSFAFDSIVGAEEEQENIFEKVGLNSTTHCLQGYNCSIFAYGQTGSGKTFTMMGVGQEDPKAFEKRGLVPRTLEHLFECIDKEQEESRTEYLVKCTFLEIYNETIIDLLDKNNSNLQLRQDLKKGVYVEGVSEETISKAEEALQLLRRGSKGRHVGSTYYNQTSSRSHSVFTLLLQSKFTKNGVVNVKVRRFHFIDLAGSERTRHSNGERLREGCSINKSLHVLGMVINSLVEATEGKAKHVNYRDSKLTFLLKDALGGNSKTHLIANISPSLNAYPQTLSTLNFARRVKLIKLNKALINEDASGNLQALKSQILRLKQQIMVLKSHPTSSLITKQMYQSVSPISTELERVFLRSDGHLGLEKLLKDYIEESIDKETKFQVQLLKREEKIEKLYQAIREYSKNEIHLRMIVEIYEKRFQRMKELEKTIQALGAVEPTTIDSFFEEEKRALTVEVGQLRELLKETPFLKALIKQNNILREESRNPEELASIIGANMKFLSELKQELNYGIKEREQLNNIIENYAMQKDTKDIMSPRKQKELEDELESKEKHYEESIEQLGLEVNFLKANSEENQLLLKEAVEREMELEERIAALDVRVEEGERYKERVKDLEGEIQERKIKEEQLETKVDALTLELIGLKEEKKEKVEELLDEKRSNTLLKQEITQTQQAMSVSARQHEQRVESLQRQIKQFQEQLESLSALFQQTQSTYEVEKEKREKALEKKSGEIVILEERISALEMENLDYVSMIDTLKLELETKTINDAKNTEELCMKIERISNQLESERVQNKRREEELETRWKDQKVSSVDQVNKKIKELNMSLIEQENKLSDIKITHSRELQELNQQLSHQSLLIQQQSKSLSEERRQKEEHKGKESQLVISLKETKDQIKQLQLTFASNHQQVTETINSLRSTISSLQTKNKELLSSISTLEQSQLSLKEQLARKEKQLERAKDSHSQEMEMLRSQATEHKERMSIHQQSMKQIFDECLKNKDKVIGELKQQQTLQLAEEKKLWEESREEGKVLAVRMEQMKEDLGRVRGEKEERDREVEKLNDLLRKEVDQSQSRAEERESAHNEFIDRKNEEIQGLENSIESLNGEVLAMRKEVEKKEEELREMRGLMKKGEEEKESNVSELRQRVMEREEVNANLERINRELSTQVQEMTARDTQQSQEITKFQVSVAELQGRIDLLSEQLSVSTHQYQNTLTTTKDTQEKAASLLLLKQSQTQQLHTQLTKSQQTIELKNKEIQSMKSKVLDLKTKIGESIQEAQQIESIHYQQIQGYKESISQRDTTISEMKRELEETRALLSQIESEREEVEQQRERERREINESNLSISESLNRTQSELRELSQYKTKYLESDRELRESLTTNTELKRTITLISQELEDTRVQNTQLKISVENLSTNHQLKTQQTESLSDQFLEMRTNYSNLTTLNTQNQEVILRQQRQNIELEGEITQLKQVNQELEASLKQSTNEYQANTQILQREKKALQEQLVIERQNIMSKVKEMEETEGTAAEERQQELESAKEEFLHELKVERNTFNEEKQKLIKQSSELLSNQQTLQSTNRSLNEANSKLTESNQELLLNLKVLNGQIEKESQKTIGLKRLIQNLERQKQQLQKELEEKEVSYKRLLSKICKEDEPRKASEDKKTLMKTNQLLEKSRLELLEYKKMADQNGRQVKKLKAEIQVKQEHYIVIHQKAEEYCKSQEVRLSQIKADSNKLQDENTALLKEVRELSHLKDQYESMREELVGYKNYKQKSEKRREDLELTIKSLSDELERMKKQMDDKPGFNRGPDEKMIFINKIKEENGLIKREKFTLSEEVTRLKRENQILLDKLADESEEKLRLKQMQERKTLKDSGLTEISQDIGPKVEQSRKQAEIRYLHDGYAQLCKILNINMQSQPKNRGQSTLGLIISVVQGLTEQVRMLRSTLKQREREIENRNSKMQMMNREYSHYKSKDYKRLSGNEYNPTNKIVGDEFNSFENLKNRALELKQQSKLKKDKY